MKVNEVQLNPVSKEFKRQKSGKGFCNHLQGTHKEKGQAMDYICDEIIEYEKEFCNICPKEITPKIRQEINKHLKNFKK